MKVVFWGSRGSLPASHRGEEMRARLREVLERVIDAGIREPSQIHTFIDDLPFHLRSTYGTNTSCVQIVGGDQVLICDAGSGLRDLGTKLVSMGGAMPRDYHILLSHLHWDHIQGFPFFVPAYVQGVNVHFWGCHSSMEEALVRQQQPPTFPVQLRDMGSQVKFHLLEADKPHVIAGLDVSIIEQPHPGRSYGYRISKGGQTIVYSTDAEHTEDSQSADYPFLKFIEGADILIFDGQFNLADHLYTKQNWGHSSNLVGIELAVRAGVRRLCLFHSDHNFTDEDLHKFLTDSLRYRDIYDDQSEVEITIAHDGLEIDLG